MIKKGIDNNIEALRGFCAIMVLIHHCIAFSGKLNNGYNVRDAVFPFSPSGALMVLVFFMLSGYVIGLTSKSGPEFNILSYLKKRLVRLYPIYLVAILITVVLFAATWSSAIGTALFTQGLFSNVLSNNLPLWSLNHEVVYYLAAIPIIRYNIKPVYVFAFIALVLGFTLVHVSPAIMRGYSIGFSFWFMGFLLSKIKLKQASSIFEVTPNKIISLFFLLLSCEYLNTFGFIWTQVILHHIKIIPTTSTYLLDEMVTLNDAVFYLFCLYAICVAASITGKWFKWLTFAVYLSSWSQLLYSFIHGGFFKSNVFYVPGACLLISTILLLYNKQIFKSVSMWTYAGSISYALYVIHMPLLEEIGTIGNFPATTLSYFIRVAILFSVVIALSYLLEKKLQPVLKNYFFRKNARP